MDSTKPFPRVLVDIRKVRVLSRRRNLLHDIGVGCARVDKRAAQRFKELAVFCSPGSKLRYLAGPARHDVLMTLPQLCALYVGPSPS